MNNMQVSKNFCLQHRNFVSFAPAVKNGRVAERLGRGLQNLVQQFESARDLGKKGI